MNHKIREQIKQLAIDGGLRHTTEVVAGKTVDNYEGRLVVSFCGSEYLVIGRKARKHRMSVTNGHVTITQCKIGHDLR